MNSWVEHPQITHLEKEEKKLSLYIIFAEHFCQSIVCVCWGRGQQGLQQGSWAAGGVPGGRGVVAEDGQGVQPALREKERTLGFSGRPGPSRPSPCL